jgi:signal transduction histidine kinase
MQLAAAARDSREKELIGRLEAIRAAALDALEEVRLLSLTVHPRVLDDLGLPAALSNLAREAGRGSDVQIDVEGPLEARTLPSEGASVLYRVAQEAVANALRHGAPTGILVRLHLDADSATVEVSDDGTGFDAGSVARIGPGLGIFSMRERVALIGGTFELVSRPGSGTRVRASVPVALTAVAQGSAQ